MRGTVGCDHAGLGVDGEPEVERVRTRELIAQQALKERIRCAGEMLLRSRAVHDACDVEYSRLVAVPHTHAQAVPRRMRLDAADTTSDQRELAARHCTLDFPVNTRRDPMAVH